MRAMQWLSLPLSLRSFLSEHWQPQDSRWIASEWDVQPVLWDILNTAYVRDKLGRPVKYRLPSLCFCMGREHHVKLGAWNTKLSNFGIEFDRMFWEEKERQLSRHVANSMRIICLSPTPTLPCDTVGDQNNERYCLLPGHETGITYL